MLGKPREILESVGLKGRNRPDDTDVIQELLNMVPVQEGGPSPPLKVDGIVGPKTTNAIQQFQLKRFGWSGADGRVDPGHQTLRWLKVFEGQFGRKEAKIARMELTGGRRGVSDAYFVIIAFGWNATYSLGSRPEPDPKRILDHLTFTNDLTRFRTVQTQQLRGPRSFETKSASETIFPDPNDPAGSLIFLHLDFPRADLDSRTDFVEVAIKHRWIDPSLKPPGFRASKGSFFLMHSSFG